MMGTVRRIVIGCVTILCLAGLGMLSTHAVVVGLEDFDGGAINLSSTISVFDYAPSDGEDVFGRVSTFNGGSGTGGPLDVMDDSVVNTNGINDPNTLPGDTRALGLVLLAAAAHRRV